MNELTIVMIIINLCIAVTAFILGGLYKEQSIIKKLSNEIDTSIKLISLKVAKNLTNMITVGKFDKETTTKLRVRNTVALGMTKAIGFITQGDTENVIKETNELADMIAESIYEVNETSKECEPVNDSTPSKKKSK